MEETLRALDDLVCSGKVRYIGASNFAAWQLAHANTIADFHGWSPFVSIQNHYHMFATRNGRSSLIAMSTRWGSCLFPAGRWFPYGEDIAAQRPPVGSRGENSPYVQKYMTDANYDKVEKMTAWAEERDHTMGELAHAWLLGQPQVGSVISGATKIEQIQANAKAGDWLLTAEEFTAVNAILAG